MRSQWQIAGWGDKDHEDVQEFNNASSYLNAILIWGVIQLSAVRVTG